MGSEPNPLSASVCHAAALSETVGLCGSIGDGTISIEVVEIVSDTELKGKVLNTPTGQLIVAAAVLDEAAVLGVRLLLHAELIDDVGVGAVHLVLVKDMEEDEVAELLHAATKL